jgi:hypothetical protein
MAFRKGDAVTHPAYGRGTVTGLRINGYEVRVGFGSFHLWVPARELTAAGGGLRIVREEPEGQEAAPPPRPEPGRASFDAILRLLTGEPEKKEPPKATPGVPAKAEPDRRKSHRPEPKYRPGAKVRPVPDMAALEAFRLGIVPLRHIKEWTVGREQEVAQVRTFLHDPAEGAILVEGAYGAGKSHLLNYLAGEAASEGFAVAMAGFDPSEATAAFPKKAYRRLVQGFSATVDGHHMDFRGFLVAVAHRPNWREVLGDHWLLGPFLTRLETGKVDEDDWEIVEARARGAGDGPTLHDYSTCANIYCNLVTALSRAAAEVLGMSGLAVLLDEAEVARNVMYRYQALRGVNFFRGLVLSANDDPALLDEERVRENSVTSGSETRLVYSGHNRAAYTTGIPAHLKVAFALTPGSLQDEFRRTRETIQRVSLDVLSMDDLRELFRRICDCFESVYGVHVGPRERDRLFRLLSTADRVTSTRRFIKGAVETLDYVRFYPEGNVEQVIVEGVG